MKSKKIKKLIQAPLRFHHQDIHDELKQVKEEIAEIKLLLSLYITEATPD